MKKTILALCVLAGISAYAIPLMETHKVISTVAETNDTYVYNLTVSLKVPMVKYNRSYGVYTEYQNQTLKGYLYLDYITEVKTVEISGILPGVTVTNEVVTHVKPDVYLYDSKTKADIGVEVDELGTSINILGKDYKQVACAFSCVNKCVTPTVAGYRNLEFCGNGSTKDVKTAIEVCTFCGFTDVVKGKCRRINSLNGQVIGAYSTGCGDEATAFESTVCGFDITANHAANPCFGTWKATYKETISND